MRIVFIGPPGAGKGTQSRLLSERLALLHLSTGDMLRAAVSEGTPRGREAEGCLRGGHLVPDALVQDMAFERLSQPDAERGFLLDGFPRTAAQAGALDQWLAQRSESLDAAVRLTVPTEELFARLAERGRHDDDPDIIRKRLEQFEALARPLTDYYQAAGMLRQVDGMGTPDEVYGRVLASLGLAA